MSKKVLYAVSGTWPPEICGVGDYMHNLVNDIQEKGVFVERVTIKRYSLFVFIRLFFLVTVNRNAKVFMSYPTEGYGRSILPFMISYISSNKLIVHIHEYASKNKTCRKLLRLFKGAKTVYFSNQSDLDKYREDTSIYSKESNWFVVPTPSNIMPFYINNHNRSTTELLHFGQIRPNKGLEKLLLLFQKLYNDERYEINLKLIGGVPKGYEIYADAILAEFRSVGVEVKLNLSSKEISNELASSDFGVFIFPDGADERRGSLIAALDHEVICFTTYSERTPFELRYVTFGVDYCNDEDIVDRLYVEISSYLCKVKTIEENMIPEMTRYSSDKSFSSISKNIISEFGFEL